MVNVDIKIISELLPLTRQVIGSVTANNLTTYVPGRYTGESVRLMSDLLEFTETHISRHRKGL